MGAPGVHCDGKYVLSGYLQNHPQRHGGVWPVLSWFGCWGFSQYFRPDFWRHGYKADGFLSVNDWRRKWTHMLDLIKLFSEATAVWERRTFSQMTHKWYQREVDIPNKPLFPRFPKSPSSPHIPPVIIPYLQVLPQMIFVSGELPMWKKVKRAGW